MPFVVFNYETEEDEAFVTQEQFAGLKDHAAYVPRVVRRVYHVILRKSPEATSYQAASMANHVAVQVVTTALSTGMYVDSVTIDIEGAMTEIDLDYGDIEDPRRAPRQMLYGSFSIN